mgnify:FL=1
MAIRKINVGKNFKNPTVNSKSTKTFKTERMFKTIDELIKRADELRQRKFEVKVNEKLLTVQYR